MKKMISLTGPSGSGKSTQEKKIVELLNAHKVVSHTTRKPRVGEAEGVDYYYVDEKYFKQNEDDFVENVNFSGNFYGAHKDSIKDGLNVIVVEPTGLRQIITKMDVIKIYLSVSPMTLEKRMLERGDAPESIKSRIAGDNIAANAGGIEFDCIIHTDSYDENQVFEFIKEFLNRWNNNEKSIYRY